MTVDTLHPAPLAGHTEAAERRLKVHAAQLLGAVPVARMASKWDNA